MKASSDLPIEPNDVRVQDDFQSGLDVAGNVVGDLKDAKALLDELAL